MYGLKIGDWICSVRVQIVLSGTKTGVFATRRENPEHANKARIKIPFPGPYASLGHCGEFRVVTGAGKDGNVPQRNAFYLSERPFR